MKIKKGKVDWFEDWFDSKYYHLLYKNRDFNEAEQLITNLITYLKPVKSSKMLDVACGRGRHAKYIHQFGFYTDAFDLSKNSINYAKKYESESLNFFINDIRTPLKNNFYQYVFNIFTSFGYFIDDKDNLQSIDAMSQSLTENGFLIIDYLNVNYTLSNLKKTEVKIVQDIAFNINREIEDDFIIKHIKFVDNEIPFHYTERVKMINLDLFKTYLTYAGLTIFDTFGNYILDPFDENHSERLIIIAKKL